MGTAIMGTTMRKRRDEFSGNYHECSPEISINFTPEITKNLLQKLPFKIRFC